MRFFLLCRPSFFTAFDYRFQLRYHRFLHYFLLFLFADITFHSRIYFDPSFDILYYFAQLQDIRYFDAFAYHFF